MCGIVQGGNLREASLAGAASQESSADSQAQADLSLITNRLRELEEENAEPERQEALRRRKKQLKEVASFVEDRGRSAEEKIAFLLQRVQQQVCMLRLLVTKGPPIMPRVLVLSGLLWCSLWSRASWRQSSSRCASS